MFKTRKLPKILGLSICLLVSQAWSAEQMTWHNKNIANFKPSVKNLKIQQKTLLSSPNRLSGEYLTQLSSHKDHNKINHIRLQQMYQGVPVFAGYVIVHSDKNLKNTLQSLQDAQIQGNLYQNLYKDLGDISSDYLQHQAAVLAKIKKDYRDAQILQEKITPIIYVDKTKTAIWAYKVVLSVQKNGALSQPNFIVSRLNDETMLSWNDLKTLNSPAKAQGYGGNEKIGKISYGETYPALNITRNKVEGMCYLENDFVKVINSEDVLKQGEWLSINEMPGMSFECLDPSFANNNLFWTGFYNDGLDEVNGGYSPSNDALFYGETVQRMYKSWYNVDVLRDWDSNPTPIVMIVHDKESMDNAAWDGNEIILGDGDDDFYPMVTLNIIAHEASHGFTQMYSNLIYFSESGALNESFSDMAAQTAEYYLNGKASWMVGQDILKEHTKVEAVRYMDKPSRDGRSIDTVDAFYSAMNVHRASGVFNRLSYLLANQPKWTPREAFHVMLKANMDYWTPFAGFQDALCGAEFAAKDLGYNVDDVIWAGNQVGIKVDCNKLDA